MKRLNKKLTFIEKAMILVTFILVVSFPVLSIVAKSELSSTNYKVEAIKYKVNTKEKNNESIKMKINELVSLESMEAIAKQEGLSYTSNIIKMVEWSRNKVIKWKVKIIKS